jgi:hypothetical protein
MWIYTKQGYVSIVQDRDDKDKLWVRARKPEPLIHMFGEFPKYTLNSDYMYRHLATRTQVSEILSHMIYEDIDYPNFKESINEPLYACMLHDIWAIGLAYSRRTPIGKRKKPIGSFSDD